MPEGIVILQNKIIKQNNNNSSTCTSIVTLEAAGAANTIRDQADPSILFEIFYLLERKKLKIEYNRKISGTKQ